MTNYPNKIRSTVINTLRSTLKNTVTTLNKTGKKALTVSAISMTFASLSCLSAVSHAQEALTLDDLLNQLEQGQITQTKQNQARESH